MENRKQKQYQSTYSKNKRRASFTGSGLCTADNTKSPYERGEFRYYNFLQDKICLIHDIFDFGKYPQNYYSPKNPLEAKKIDPV